MTKYDPNVTFADGDDYHYHRQDSAFYTWDAQAHQLVATIEYKEREIRVFCDGEMRIHLWESKEARERGDNHDVIRYADQLVKAGITNDEELAKAEMEDRLEWINNSWFDLYAYGDGIGDGWVNAVGHGVDDSVSQALEIILDDKMWAEIAGE